MTPLSTEILEETKRLRAALAVAEEVLAEIAQERHEFNPWTVHKTLGAEMAEQALAEMHRLMKREG